MTAIETLLTKSKKQLIACVTACGLTLAVVAQEISVKPLNDIVVYRAGEPAEWLVSVEKQGTPAEGKLKFLVKKGGLTPVEEGAVDLTNGTAVVRSTRADPGALLLEACFEHSTNYGGAVFSPEQILPSAEEPVDFDEFWRRKIEELHAVPVNAVLEKVDTGDEDVDYWKITMDNIRGTKVYGQIAKPKNSSGSLPAVVQFQYAGVYPLKKEWVVNPAKEGWLAMNIIAHDLPIDQDEPFYRDLKAGPLNVYPAIGCEDREASYFLRMYLACFRAADYLSQRPEWNGKTLLVTGTSQGGMQAVMTAGLHPAVTALIAEVPAGCDLTGALVGRASGWPAWSWSGREKAIEVSRYYDAVNFARRVKCSVLVGVGAIDRVCPPEGVIAMFNQLKGPKRLIVLPVGEHAPVGHEPFQAVLSVWSESLRTGGPLPVK